MQKTKIEWCDATWNPVTGCLHGCEYCYARGITKRFGGYETHDGNDKHGFPILTMHKDETGELHDLSLPMWIMRGKCLKTQLDKAPYPFIFDPTFHRYRLDEPQKMKKPRNIFVCLMADLFGDWIPAEWINEILWNACGKGEQHRYLFLTKNPKRYHEFIRSRLDYRINHWYGTTVTDSTGFALNGRAHELHKLKDEAESNIFLSIEPLHERITGTPLSNLKFFDWVIIGAETGKRKDKVIPEKQWILEIVEQCKDWSVPVFMKESLLPIMGEENMLREFPSGLSKN